VIVVKPGQSMGTHYHNEAEETFYFLEGTPQMIVDGEPHRVRAGDAFRLEPGERHSIVNDSNAPTRLVFIKCPYVPGDKVDVD
jgi:quercetin dioxygenase-like cupin family protein